MDRHRFVTAAAMGANQPALPCVRMSAGERRRLVLGASSSSSCSASSGAVRSEATPATRGDGDAPKYYLCRQPCPGGTGSTVPSLAPKSRNNSEGILWGVDESIREEALACEFLHLASRICLEVESEFQLHKSKKPHRLSTTSWDLLD